MRGGSRGEQGEWGERRERGEQTRRMRVRIRRWLIAVAGASLVSGAATGAATSADPAAAAATDCQTSQLVVWLDTVPNGAAGSLFYDLELTNLSARTCSLSGYPGVSAVSLSGRRLGSSAARQRGKAARTISLGPRRTATVSLRLVDVMNYPAARCRPTAAAGLRVFPPNDTAATLVPYPFEACSRAGPSYLSVGPVTGAARSQGGPQPSAAAP